MKKLGRKILGLLMAGITTVSLAACTGSSNSNSGVSADSTAGKGDPVELTLWHTWPTGSITTIIDTFVKQYEKENNVKIQVDATQQDEYQQRKLKVAAANGSQGDVFMTYGAGYSKPFIAAGAVLPLDSYLEADKTKDRLMNGVLDYFTYDGKVYGLPLKKWAGILFCNTELFEKNNVAYPETWDQMMTAVNTFRSKNITPMVLGAKDAWHIGMIQNALAVRTAGVEASNMALSGEGSFDTPEIIKSAQLLVDLNKAGAFVEGTLGVSADEAQMEFFAGEVPMYFSGSWTAADCESDENAIKGKIKVMPMPTVDGGKGDADTYLGGAIDGYMVNNNTKHPEEAVKFAIALTEYQCKESYKIGDSIPTWKGDVDESQINPVLIQINKLTQNATGYVLAWDTFLTGAAIDNHYNLLQALIGGKATPEEFAKKMQEANK
ncbi:extracellular solute-binding protein [Ruminiclostridium cellobioparum]|uniref:extracellular solute-binding protein n=1 Tax=Ruminiclostridium cellobioparum TaxID=29355 RepID=UPI0028B16B09|nr:extracellular solute-binding protein [Ruminiclostridium cellobioparum]